MSDIDEAMFESWKDIPTSPYLLKKFFQTDNWKEEDRNIYTDFYLSYSKLIEVLQGDLNWWLKKKNDIHVKETQAEKMSRLGWFLFPYNDSNISLLTRTFLK